MYRQQRAYLSGVRYRRQIIHASAAANVPDTYDTGGKLDFRGSLLTLRCARFTFTPVHDRVVDYSA